jgi:hypothetical protein
MKNSKIIIILLVVIIIMLGYMTFARKPQTEIVQVQDQTHIQPQTNPNPHWDNPTITGDSTSLVSFSLTPGQEVSGKVTLTGSLKGYFNEGSTPLWITDESKTKVYLQTPLSSTGDWMVNTPIAFSKTVDFSSMPKGKAYLEIKADNPSGLPQYESSIWIPIVIK